MGLTARRTDRLLVYFVGGCTHKVKCNNFILLMFKLSAVEKSGIAPDC